MQTPQSGLYILLVLGPAEGFVDKTIQFSGVTASFLSVVRGIAEYHLYTEFNSNSEEDQQQVNLFYLLKSSTFFLPHTLFRSFSIAVIAAFIGYYAFIPFTSIFILNACTTFCCASGTSPLQFFSLVTSFFTPSVLEPSHSHDRGLLKRSTLVSTVILLTSLIAIFFLPTIFPTESALLPGLHHLNFDNSSSRCDPVCNGENFNTTVVANMTMAESTNPGKTLCRLTLF